MNRPLLQVAAVCAVVLATTAPAWGAEGRGARQRPDAGLTIDVISPNGGRLGPEVARTPAMVAQVLAMVPEVLRPLVAARLQRGAGGRPKPGGTTMFEPSSLVPLWRAMDGPEVGLGFGGDGKGRTADRERATVVVVYVGSAF